MAVTSSQEPCVYPVMEGNRGHNSYMRCSIFIMLCLVFYMSTF